MRIMACHEVIPYGKSQLRRAAVSVPSNIAEGLIRKTANDKIHFLNKAQASMSEIDTLVEICVTLDYLDREMSERSATQLVQAGKLISGLTRKIKN
jgi:four helix bundle protein